MKIHILIIRTGGYVAFFTERQKSRKRNFSTHHREDVDFSKAPLVSSFDCSDLCPTWVEELIGGETH